jgi:lipoic acid synthetase
VRAVRQRTGATVEVLTPDFVTQSAALDLVVAAVPEVFNHNTETVPRLYRAVRGSRADYRWTLMLLQRVKELNPRIKTKSGLMLGFGETIEEVLEVLVDLRDHGVDFLTVGQYLQPDTARYLPVVRYLAPDEFAMLERAARQLGFRAVASGPFVRSSYHAREILELGS